MNKRIGILTSGGDCPGLNAVIRAVVRRAALSSTDVLGVKNGWRGLIEGDIQPLTRSSVTGILPRGGTILGTSRATPTKDAQTIEAIKHNWQVFDIAGLIVVGGEGTLRGALELWRNHSLPLVGVPKTIDNDLNGTDRTFGFDTAVGVVADAIDRLHSTAESHHRVMVVEVMGRHTGWIAAYGGIAGGADVILVPEYPFRFSRVCELLKQRQQQGRAFSIIVVAEDARPALEEDFLGDDTRAAIYQHDRLGGIGALLAREIEERLKVETRVTQLGYVQRGGSPTAYDRVLATRFGVKAFEMIEAGEWGRMVSLQGSNITSVNLSEATDNLKLLDPEIYRIAEIFAG